MSTTLRGGCSGEETETPTVGRFRQEVCCKNLALLNTASECCSMALVSPDSIIIARTVMGTSRSVVASVFNTASECEF